MSQQCCGAVCVKCPVVVATGAPLTGSLTAGQMQFDANSGFYYYQYGGQTIVVNPAYGAGLQYNVATQSVSVGIDTNAGLAFTAGGQISISCTQLINHCGLVTAPQLAAVVGAAIAALPAGGIVTGTFASVLAPTAAPTAANPATRLTNLKGEVFDWTLTAWVLVGNGFFINNKLLSNVPVPSMVSTQILAVTAPRAGVVHISANALLDFLATSGSAGHWIQKNGVFFARAYAYLPTTAGIFLESLTDSAAVYDVAAAGDVYSLVAYQGNGASSAEVASGVFLQLKYI